MNKLIVLLMLLTSIISACWFTELNFGNNYIYGVNNNINTTSGNENQLVRKSSGLHVYYPVNSTLFTVEYYNNAEVSLPITVHIKISPRELNNPDSNIIYALLDYRVVRVINSNYTIIKDWTTVGEINNPINTRVMPYPVFGKNTIYPTDLSAGDIIQIRLYLMSADGYVTYRRSSVLTNYMLPDVVMYDFNNWEYSDGTTVPFLMNVIWNGKIRVN